MNLDCEVEIAHRGVPAVLRHQNMAFSLQKFRNLCAGICIFLTAFSPLASVAAWACQENAMLVFDSSGSMGSIKEGLPKIDVAREAATDILPDVTRFRATGLITYGGEFGPVCNNVNLKIPPMRHSGELILAELGLMRPNGQTPLSDAVMLAAQSLKSLQHPGIIVLVTDGLENCGYNACALGRKLRTENPGIRVHVIGFHLHARSESQISCLSQQTGGTYTSTNSLETLREALRKTLSCPRISSLKEPLDVSSFRHRG